MNNEPDNIFESIKDFHKSLERFRYGILYKGKPCTNPREIDFEKEYRTLSTDEMDRYGIGVCYDYVLYEASWFRNHNIPFHAYYVESVDKDGDIPSHTFLTFQVPGMNESYYFEVSWYDHRGIKKYKNEDLLLKDIKRICINHGMDPKTYICVKYNPFDPGLYHVNYKTFMRIASGGSSAIMNNGIEESKGGYDIMEDYGIYTEAMLDDVFAKFTNFKASHSKSGDCRLSKKEQKEQIAMLNQLETTIKNMDSTFIPYSKLTIKTKAASKEQDEEMGRDQDESREKNRRVIRVVGVYQKDLVFALLLHSSKPKDKEDKDKIKARGSVDTWMWGDELPGLKISPIYSKYMDYYVISYMVRHYAIDNKDHIEKLMKKYNATIEKREKIVSGKNKPTEESVQEEFDAINIQMEDTKTEVMEESSDELIEESAKDKAYEKLALYEKQATVSDPSFIPLPNCTVAIHKVERVRHKNDTADFATLEGMLKHVGRRMPEKKHLRGNTMAIYTFNGRAICAIVNIQDHDWSYGILSGDITVTDDSAVYSAVNPAFQKHAAYYSAAMNVYAFQNRNAYKSAHGLDGDNYGYSLESFRDYMAEYGMDSVIQKFEETADEDLCVFDDWKANEDNFNEAANIDDDIITIIKVLNGKGYKTKASCSGHPSMRVKGDVYADGVKNGKLYSTARIVFAKAYDFPNYPKGWEKRVHDDGSLGIYVKAPTFSVLKGLPKDQYYAWKKKYMYQLEKWANKLPAADTLKKSDNTKAQVNESADNYDVVDDILLDIM